MKGTGTFIEHIKRNGELLPLLSCKHMTRKKLNWNKKNRYLDQIALISPNVLLKDTHISSSLEKH